MFPEEQIFTMAGAALYNRIMAQYAESGLGPEEIAAQLADNGFPGLTAETAPQIFKKIAQEYYGETLPQSWANLNREQAALIQSGQDPFEGWEVPDSPPPNKWLAGATGFIKGAQLDHLASGIYKGWRALTYPHRKQRDWRQERADALTESALSRARSGPAYQGAYDAEVERLSAQPQDAREILHTDMTKGEVAGLQVNPHDYWDEDRTRDRRIGVPIPGMQGAQKSDAPNTQRTRDQEHARRLGTAEARHEVARTSSIGLGKIMDAGSRLGSGERTQEQYDARVGGILGPDLLGPIEERK